MDRVTIHSEHPFSDPEGDRRPARRLRGRLPAPVTIWTSVYEGEQAGLTVSSLLVADGEPARLVCLLDGESALWPVLRDSGRAAVSVLGPDDRQLADVLAGVAPSPGGAFRTGEWTGTDWGPVVSGRAWAGGRLVGEPRPVGWPLLVELELEHTELSAGTGAGVLGYRRGRYLTLPDD